jgi:hypothetical protein
MVVDGLQVAHVLICHRITSSINLTAAGLRVQKWGLLESHVGAPKTALAIPPISAVEVTKKTSWCHAQEMDDHPHRHHLVEVGFEPRIAVYRRYP